ncbi:unnamed protein product [Acanthoscelides obtectus]|uniref:Uncharacterized protein n=1 Tax=Acanthoscelides obtectus TaxID=200917 RepID=A0A9P0LN63_ACAOB|nr:unnamed protein product [Acanthoscelides obtectus]CAK1635819.1 hypothetical protein AOBTE_LOCUS9535 [Acanthoscelides obtectus]
MDYDVDAYSSDKDAKRPKIIRHRPNYFDDLDFLARFHLSRNTAETLLDEVYEDLVYPTSRNSCLTPLLLALRYYANGSFLTVAGDFAGVSKSTASY